MSTIITSILSILSSVVGTITQEQQLKISLLLQQDKEMNDLLTKQADINVNEAANPNFFVAGWRPGIGWGLGAIVVFYAFFTLAVNFCISLGCHIQQFPRLDPMVRDMIMGMLGLNMGTRTFEKYTGVQHNH